MNIEACREFCISKKGVTEEFPFGPNALVMKVMGKMFALIGLDDTPFKMSLKCEPERAIALRDEHDEFITGAFHMNKKHWNSILAEALPPALVQELIDHSYDLVVKGLTKKQQQELQNLENI